MAGPTTTRTVLEPSLTFDLTIHSHTSIKSIAFSPISTNSQRFIYLGTSSGSLLLLSTNPNEKIPTKDPKSTLDFDISSRNVSLVNSVSFGDSPLDTVLFLDEIGKDICYRRVPPEEQIKDLLRKKNLKEAISLLEELESNGEMSNEMLSFVHAQVGFLLLFDLHFEEAVNHFLQSETMQPSEVFPFIMRDPNRWSLLVPRNRYWGLHPPPAPLEDVVDDGLMAIQRAIFLKKAGVDTTVTN